MEKNNNLGAGILFGFLAGGAIGAAFALLYAPKSGKELRDDIRTKSDDYLDSADKYVEQAKVKAKDLINEGKKRSDKLIDDAKIKSDELLRDAERIFKEAKSKANNSVAGGKSTLEAESNKLKGAVKAGLDAYKESKSS